MILDLTHAMVSSDFFGNLVLLVSAVFAFVIGVQQIRLSDVVEIYVALGIKQTVNHNNEVQSSKPALNIQNVGTRLIYLEKYIFNGREYVLDSQVLPSTYSQAKDAFYVIELPTNGEGHVSLIVFYTDVAGRKWKSTVFADAVNGVWAIKSLKRVLA